MGSETVVVGVDGWKRGWVAVVLVDGVVDRVFVASIIDEVAALAADASVVGVDIPIGFPESGLRPADVAAFELLGVRRSSLFFVPPRQVMEALDYDSARREALRVWDRGLSAQTYALRERILEVDSYRRADSRLIEVHPEVSFRAMAGGPLTFAKKTWNGQQQRRLLLESEGIVIPDLVEGDAGQVPADDLLDAAAAAWTANRYATGAACSLPEGASRGTDCTIWF